MAETIKGSVKETVWIINEKNPNEVYHEWLQTPKSGYAYKVHVRTLPNPHVVVTKHEPYRRKCYTRIRVLDEIPTSAQEAIDLVDAIRSGIK